MNHNCYRETEVEGNPEHDHANDPRVHQTDQPLIPVSFTKVPIDADYGGGDCPAIAIELFGEPSLGDDIYSWDEQYVERPFCPRPDNYQAGRQVNYDDTDGDSPGDDVYETAVNAFVAEKGVRD